MNDEKLNVEEIIEESQNAELDEFVYDEEEVECQETECEETISDSVLVRILKRLGAIFAIIGTTIVLYKCRGCMVKWAVRMLEKRGFTVIQPGKSVIETEEETEDDDLNDQDEDIEETED